MRRKRSARKKKMRKKALYQAASLLSIAAFGIAQVTPSSQAVFSHSVTIKDGEITSSFVFPETIEGLVNEIKVEMEKVESLREQAGSIYGKIEQAESSEQAISDNQLDMILESAKVSQEIANAKMNQLNIYLAQAKQEVIDDESAMDILIVIEDGIKTATELMDSMDIVINEIEGMANQANVMIAVMVQVETAALEKEMIAEIAQKALEGLTGANTLASDILAKYGDDFDLSAFQALTEELAKTETDLQKALEDAENYMNELKAYVDGTKEVASPDVLEEAKANYEKVQLAIDSLKETMENTKSTKTEVQAKIEQEIKRQEEEAQRIEQERIKQEEEAKKAQQELENQNAPAVGGGAANPQSPVEENQPNPETPPVGEVTNPEIPSPGGGEAPNTGQPPVEGELPNPENPPVGEEQPNPDEPPVEGEQPNPSQPPVGGEEQIPGTSPEEGEQPNPDQPPVEEEQQKPDQPPTDEEPPETPPSEREEQDQNDQSDGGIENQPARPDDEESQTGNEDDINPDQSSNDDDQPETEQPSNANQNNPTQTDGTKEAETNTEETINSEETTTAEAAPTEEETQSTDASTTSENSENNSSENGTDSSGLSTSASESIERDTVASLNAVNIEQDFYSFDSLILNRRDEDNEFDLLDVTTEIVNQDVQKDIITMDNNHKVKINIRTYLSSKWNKKL